MAGPSPLWICHWVAGYKYGKKTVLAAPSLTVRNEQVALLIVAECRPITMQ